MTTMHDHFTIERVYPRCRAHVWSAWSQPEKKAAWFGAPASALDFRPGGSERVAFADAMGEHVNETRYFEILEEERIVFAYSMALDGRVHTVSLATVRLADEGGGTRLTFTEQMCMIPPTDGIEGRRHGWEWLLGSLGEQLDREVAGTAASD